MLCPLRSCLVVKGKRSSRFVGPSRSVAKKRATPERYSRATSEVDRKSHRRHTAPELPGRWRRSARPRANIIDPHPLMSSHFLVAGFLFCFPALFTAQGYWLRKELKISQFFPSGGSSTFGPVRVPGRDKLTWAHVNLRGSPI